MILMGIVGHKNAGKTTLTERLVATLVARGLTVSTAKRTHHALDLDQPGTDSFRHRAAGAGQVLLASDARLTLLEERAGATLNDCLARLAPCDVVLAEGWKHGTHPRLEVWRPETGRPPLAAGDPTILAVAAPVGVAVPGAGGRPVLPLDDAAAIGRWIVP